MLTKKQQKLSALFAELKEFQDSVEIVEGQINELMSETITAPARVKKNTEETRGKKIVMGAEVNPGNTILKRWSRKHDFCLNCHGEGRGKGKKHRSNGLCFYCWSTERSNILKSGGTVDDFPQKKERKQKEKKQEEEPEQSVKIDDNSKITNYACIDCDKEFGSRSDDILDVRCPSCFSSEVRKV